MTATPIILPGYPDFLDNAAAGTYGAKSVRRLLSEALQPGVCNPAAFKVAPRAAGASMSVDVGSGSVPNVAYVGDSTHTDVGLWRSLYSGAVQNADIAANVSGSPRVDQVYLAVDDSTVQGANNDHRIDVAVGTPTAGATLDNRSGAVNLPSACIRLADVLVPASATAIDASLIRDRRPWATGALARARKVDGNVVANTGAPTEISSAFRLRVECSGAPVRVCFQGMVGHAVAGGGAFVGLSVDGVGVEGNNYGLSIGYSAAANVDVPVNFDYVYTPSPGSHLFTPLWNYLYAQGNLTLLAASPTPAVFSVEELVGRDLAAFNGIN